MMDQLPYCANIKVEATSCDLGIPNTDIIGGDFITSLNTPVSITYKYTKWNGDLVEIDTNLDYTLDTKNKTFTLSNNTIFGTNEEPYIRLCCNNVKVPIVFIDSDGTGNKWFSTEIGSTDIILRGHNSNTKVKISKFCTVNWNKTTEQNIFLEKNTSGAYAEYYACEAIFGYLNGKTLKTDKQRILSTQSTPINKKFTIPRLDGIESTLSGENGSFTKKFSSYLMLGVQVKISDGYSVFQNNTKYYITGTNTVFDNTGILKTITNKRYLLTKDYFPKIFTKTNSKWNSKFFFTTQKDSSNKSYYISPSTSQIHFEYTTEIVCQTNYIPGICTIYCDDCFDECYGNSNDNCSCNFACNTYEAISEENPSPEYCKTYWSCYQNDGNYCVMYYSCFSDDWASGECSCDRFCGTDSDNNCYTYYDCDANYNDSTEINCECYGYYTICKKYTTCTNCEGYCACDSDNWEECEDDTCSSDGGQGCSPDCSLNEEDSPSTVTITASYVTGWLVSDNGFVCTVRPGTYPIEKDLGWGYEIRNPNGQWVFTKDGAEGAGSQIRSSVCQIEKPK